MTSPLSIKTNDYRVNKKQSDIYTPKNVAQFLFDLLNEKICLCRAEVKHTRIFDPAIGSGRLTNPWYSAGFQVSGVDITKRKGAEYSFFIKDKFENIEAGIFSQPDLVLCNPPFNAGYGRKLQPQVFLEHIFELFGETVPVVLFSPFGLLLNQRKTSTRWRWLRDCGTKITSIISLPLDVFPGVQFHNLIVIFNITGLEPHYFLLDKYLE